MTTPTTTISQESKSPISSLISSSPSKGLKAFPFYVGNSGCDYHRVRIPFMYAWDYLDTDAYEDFTLENLLHFLEISKLVVWNRSCPIDIEKILEIKRRTGLKIVVDLDDWVELPFKHPQYQYYKQTAAKMVLDNVKLADAVTVTTHRLASKVQPYCKNFVHVIPNALPYGHGQFAINPEAKKTEHFSIVYAGQSSHLEDVRLLSNPMNRIKSIPGIGFTMAGYSKHPIWDAMEGVFKMAPNYTRIPNRTLDTYMSIYDTAHCSIVPLVANSFNAHKSNLKLLEAAAKKLPVIVSHVPPYSDDDEAPVLWVKYQSDWYNHIQYLSRNKNAAVDYGEALHEWAIKKYNVFEWNKYRFDLYADLINKG